MSDITVLMYHAVLPDPHTAEGADAHYAVSTQNFEKHIDAMDQGGFAVRSVRDLLDSSGQRAVAVTFDDGHQSNFEHAFPLLADRGLTADFFVNATTAETRNYISWAALREMSDAGMSIQSHGRTHRYLDDLTTKDVLEELSGSKKEIEDRIGRPVDLFAPPHGRFNDDVLRIARQAGYRAMCCSRPGQWKPDTRVYEIPRVAVLGSTSREELVGWAQGSGVAKMVLRYRVLGMAKTLLGNQAYEKLRGRLLGSGGGP